MEENVHSSEQIHTADNLVPTGLRQYIPLLAIVGFSMATVGFITGIREPRKTERGSVSAVPHVSDVPAAVNYSELPTARLSPNAHWVQNLNQLKFEKPEIFETVTRTEEMKLAALADRAKNRAYDGAPPTIPHPADALSNTSCLACHGEGLKIGDRIATKISHAQLTNCTQCHVEQSTILVENSFVGVYRAGPGERASPGAPPTIPHHTWLRENCASCHGLLTRSGIRTTHPWLTSCTQCHAPSAVLDQVDFSGAKR
ncbi:MAG: nitrate reductase cytochrome c-type subunit [Planctomycetes bacterium]|nr:nitrate reductase cytochrome c-type subunit [Planctomycetota bacterium]